MKRITVTCLAFVLTFIPIMVINFNSVGEDCDGNGDTDAIQGCNPKYI